MSETKSQLEDALELIESEHLSLDDLLGLRRAVNAAISRLFDKEYERDGADESR